MNDIGSNFFRPIISASLSPNVEKEDIAVALGAFLDARNFLKGPEITKVEHWFNAYCQSNGARTFVSGRTALYAILKAFHIGPGTEVVVQAFTCVAVPNSVIWAGATPVYCDIDETYNLDPQKLSKAITPKTRAIIVQHTFGLPANMDAIVSLAKKHNCIVIEDCAHGLGATYKGKKLGTLGDAAFFSFGRDKVISSVWGGVGVINIKDSKVHDAFRSFYESLPQPSYLWTLIQLAHPLFFSLIIPLYRIGVGKVLLEILKKIGAISMPVDVVERYAQKPPHIIARYPNALAKMILVQLAKLDRYARIRRQTARIYTDALSKKNKNALSFIPEAGYLRYPLWVVDPQSVLTRAKKHGMLLGLWYRHIVDPVGVDFAKINFTPDDFPRAQMAAAHIVNLPTRIDSSDARRLVELI